MNLTLRLGAVLLLSTMATSAADLTLTMKGTGKANEGAQTQLWSAKFMRTNNPGAQTDTLVDYEKGVNYTINHSKKTVEMFSWDDLETMAEGVARQMKDLPPQVLAMMPGGGGGEVTVENAGKETVAGRTCQKWVITAGKMVIDSSYDASLKPPIPAVSYSRFLKLKNLANAVGPAAAQMKKVGEELAKIQGMALKTRTVMPYLGESVIEATEVKEGAISASAFDLPAGYKTIDRGKELAKNYKR
jgi:hypothetical protein